MWKCNICGHQNQGNICEVCGFNKKKNERYIRIDYFMVFSIIIQLLLGSFLFGFVVAETVEGRGKWTHLIIAFAIAMLALGILRICARIKSRNYDSELKRLEAQQKNNETEIKSGIKKIEMVCECGRVYPEGAVFCAVDGKRLTKKIVDNYVWTCPNCRKIFPDGIKYCPACGRKLVKSPK
ncbi:MAG TPA: hypothetical protein DCW90_15225 [Lachnospiraceae bacterium]|nr:hypothetical protein [Lachnospiraceae bacterium]